MNAQPDLSVAIIFKNEIRCLERCLKSIQPLRERFSVEIVMADTGSDDGSRAVAERYADIVFDFPWINDFAAARNAVLDRCTGKWALVMDCDEWLEADIDELEYFLHDEKAAGINGVAVPVWSYVTAALKEHRDVVLLRMLRMRANPRYEGAIHEHPVFDKKDDSLGLLEKTVLHHDGYIMLNDGSAAGDAKRARNMKLLRRELEKTPEDLRRLMEVLDVGANEPDYYLLLHRAISLIGLKKPDWDVYGPPIMMRAVQIAQRDELPEFDEWVETAHELFPGSYFTRVDIAHFEMTYAYMHDDYARAARTGETYLRAWRELQTDQNPGVDLTVSALQWRSETSLREAMLLLADIYRQLEQPEKARSALQEVTWKELDYAGIYNAINIIARIYAYSNLDVSMVMNGFWAGICAGEEDKKATEERKKAFLTLGAAFFEGKMENSLRPTWEMFLSLRNKCILGDAAALLRCKSKESACEVLEKIDSDSLPIPAQVHAKRLGVLPAPILSVAIIFKNEKRCIERCLRSLLPLRDKLRIEIVMADTGSDDGSRKIAEQYADILFDFEWIDDFAAARNAVLDHCSGTWVLMIDCDEWLAPEIDELIAYLHGEAAADDELAAIPMRNYMSGAVDEYQDFLACRLFRLSAAPRYEGAIHEQIRFGAEKRDGVAVVLGNTHLFHDGYALHDTDPAADQAKRERNMRLLRRELEVHPDDLRYMMLTIDSAGQEPDFPGLLRRAVTFVERRANGWEKFGPPILRSAVQAALQNDMPEFNAWAELARNLFPNSLFTRVDIIGCQMVRTYLKEDYHSTVRYGEEYLAAWNDAQKATCQELSVSSLIRGDDFCAIESRMMLADSFHKLGQNERARELLRLVPPTRALSHCETIEEADEILSVIDDLTVLPPAAFIHALKLGVAFPIQNKYLPIELADTLAVKLTEDKPFLREAAIFAATSFENDADLLWARSLALTALKANDWKEDADPQTLIRAFVQIESAFLPRCYTEYALHNPGCLPPIQRFALHMVNAFSVLEPSSVSSEFKPPSALNVHDALTEFKDAVIAAPDLNLVVSAALNALT